MKTAYENKPDNKNWKSIRIDRAWHPSLAGSIIPSYLFTKAGQAYHLAEAGNTKEALSLYAEAARGPLSGSQWLASNFAQEQERRKILPTGSIETTFLRAMVMFREGKRQQAEPLFREIARTVETRFEVAVSLNILGNLVGRSNRTEAEGFFQRSIEIGKQIGNQHHVAQTLHSLANLLSRDPQRAQETEELYIRAIDILEKSDDRTGVAQTLHGLANLLARDPKRAEEAEKRYSRSIEIDEKLDNLFGVALALFSLANLLARDPTRADEAEKLYLQSIKIGERIGNQNHIAQTLRSLSFIVENRSPKEAEQLLERSFELNRRANNRRGQEIVRASLRALRDRFKL
jgi:tetratricopeptide (TPR) repeat protein